ncbi:MAG: hypothetical protein AAFW65_08405 [Pseudomonadota bacterium]
MTSRVAAVALAASALIAAPAFADYAKPRVGAAVTVDVGRHASLTLTSGQSHRGHVHKAHHRGGDRYYSDRGLRRDAIRQCRRAIRNEGYSRGFRDVDFDDRRVRQVGPRGFVVRFETEFEGRRREFERDVRCEVRRGRIVALDGIPYPRRGHRGGRDWRSYDRIHAGHDHGRGDYCPLDGGPRY